MCKIIGYIADDLKSCKYRIFNINKRVDAVGLLLLLEICVAISTSVKLYKKVSNLEKRIMMLEGENTCND